jgi:hypothetical protein
LAPACAPPLPHIGTDPSFSHSTPPHPTPPGPHSPLQELLAFLLGPEARDLRPLLAAELTNAADLFLRDRLRRAAAAAAAAFARPRLPLPLPPGLSGLAPTLPALPLPPGFSPPVPVPGRGLMPAQQLVDELAPPLSQPEEVYLQVGGGTAALHTGRVAAHRERVSSPGLDACLRGRTVPCHSRRRLLPAIMTWPCVMVPARLPPLCADHRGAGGKPAGRAAR